MKKITLFFVVFVVLGISQEAFAGKTRSGEWTYFTQGKNITNLNTQLPAKKGLLEKREVGIKSVGNYQEIVHAPRTHLGVNVEIKLNKNVLTVGYGAKPNMRNMSSRIPISQQLFQETVETYIYLIFPKSLNLINEIQAIYTINNMTEKEALLQACNPENTKLSELLRKCNAVMEGTYELTKDERIQMERMFDNLSDVMGKYGKVTKAIKTGVKYAMKKEEKKIIKRLENKYGNGYLIYKIPFYVPEGIAMTYSHIGKINKFFFDTSKLDETNKIFVEIPRLSFEINTAGAIRRASLEELTYEIVVEPVRDVDEPIKSMGKFAEQIFKALKTKDERKIAQFVMLDKEDCMDKLYLYPVKSKDKCLFDFFSHMSPTDRKKMIDSIPMEDKNLIEKEISTNIISYNKRRKRKLHKKIDEFYAESKKHKVDWISARYLRCFNVPKNNLYIVFSNDNKEYVFNIKLMLLSNGWKICGYPKNICSNTCWLMKQESNANIVPGKTKKELKTIRLQHTKSRFDKIEESVRNYYTESGIVLNKHNLYSIFDSSDSLESGYCNNELSSSTAGFLDGWGKQIIIMSHLTGGIVLKSSGPDKKMDSDDDLFKAVTVGEQKEPDENVYRSFLHKDFREISQEEINSIDKKLLRKMFFEGGPLSLFKAIIRTKKFSNSELFKMTNQSKDPLNATHALYRCNIISWKMFGQMRDDQKRKKSKQ